MKKILFIIGSLRKDSFNRKLAEEAERKMGLFPYRLRRSLASQQGRISSMSVKRSGDFPQMWKVAAVFIQSIFQESSHIWQQLLQ